MEIPEILQQLERNTGKFPQEAVEEAVARREEITSYLLHILEDTVVRAAELQADRDYMAHIYAMFLLAQFRETRAYPLALRFAHLPEDTLDSLGGGFIPESLGKILASVCGGDSAGIQSLIENESLDEWVRGSAINGLVALVGAGLKSRDEIVNYFAGLFRGKLVREHSNVWDALILNCCDIYPAELMDEIKRAYRDGVVDKSVVSLEDVQRALASGKDSVLERLSGGALVEDIAGEIGWWACFNPDQFEKMFQAQLASSPLAAPLSQIAAPTPVVPPAQIDPPAQINPPAKIEPPFQATLQTPIKRSAPKVGRNDPCPCGSGKKYKKCCGA